MLPFQTISPLVFTHFSAWCLNRWNFSFALIQSCMGWCSFWWFWFDLQEISIMIGTFSVKAQKSPIDMRANLLTFAWVFLKTLKCSSFPPHPPVWHLYWSWSISDSCSFWLFTSGCENSFLNPSPIFKLVNLSKSNLCGLNICLWGEHICDLKGSPADSQGPGEHAGHNQVPGTVAAQHFSVDLLLF